MLAHDSAGFLTGDPIEILKQQVDLLSNISDDISEIKGILGSIAAAQQLSTSSDNPTPLPPIPQISTGTNADTSEINSTDSNEQSQNSYIDSSEISESVDNSVNNTESTHINHSGNIINEVADQLQQSTAEVISELPLPRNDATQQTQNPGSISPATLQPTAVQPATVQRNVGRRQREANGRFTGNGGQSPSERQAERGILNKLVNAFSRTGGNGETGLEGIEETDPTIKAAQEIKNIVNPMVGIVSKIGSLGGFVKTLFAKKGTDTETTSTGIDSQQPRTGQTTVPGRRRNRGRQDTATSISNQDISDSASAANNTVSNNAVIESTNSSVLSNETLPGNNTPPSEPVANPSPTSATAQPLAPAVNPAPNQRPNASRQLPTSARAANNTPPSEPVVNEGLRLGRGNRAGGNFFSEIRLFRRENSAYQKANNVLLGRMANNGAGSSVAEKQGAGRLPPAKKGFFGLFGKNKDDDAGKGVLDRQLRELQEINTDGDGEIKHLKAINIALNGTFWGKLFGFLFKLVLLPITLPLSIAKAVSKSRQDKREESAKRRMQNDIHGIWGHTKQMRLDLIAIRKKIGAEEETDAPDSSGGGGFLGFLMSLGPILLTALVSIGGAIVTGIVSLITMAMPIIGGALSAIGPLLLSGIGAVLSFVFSPIGLAIAAAATLAFIKDSFFAAINLFAATFPETAQFIKDSWNSAVELFNESASWISDQWDSVTETAQNFWDGLKEEFAPIIKSATDLFDWLKGVWTEITETIGGIFDSFSKFLKDKFGIDIPAVTKAVTETVDKTVEVVKETTQKAVDGGKAVVDKTKEVAHNVTSNIKDTFNYGFDVASDITSSVKSKVTGKASDNKNALLQEMANEGITDYKEQAMIMAQMDHESGGFTQTKENLHYKSADRLMSLSKSARSHGKPAVEAAIAQGDDAVAELMYGGRMGNTQKGDAAKYRGRGLVQLTGKDNYSAASKDLGIDLVNHPELAEIPEVAAKIVLWYWKKNNIGKAAKQGDVKGVTHKINGGEIGLEDRNKKFEKYLLAAKSGEFNTPVQAIASKEPPAVIAADTAKSSLAPTVANAQAKNPVFNYGMPAPTAISFSPAMPQPATPVMASVPKLPKAPDISVPLASNTSNISQSATMTDSEVGQDVSDRSIAHIVTGGIGGRYS
jgi:predicted chitinase